MQQFLLGLIAGLLLAAVGLLGLDLLARGQVITVAVGQGAPVQTQTSNPAQTQPTTQAPKPRTFTLADVAKHASAASCWAAINGGVYDLTAWINQHPGGPGAILGLCGTDASEAFNDQHEGQRRPAEELAGFKIGTLK